MTLNEKDLETLTSGQGKHLITGPPGSGKTHTLIQLVKYLISVRHADPREILILSFNRRWSKILREKTAEAIGRSIWEIPIETFYSFCTDVLEWAELERYRGSFDRRGFGKNRSFDPSTGIHVLNSVEQWDILTGIVRSLKKKDHPYSHRYMNSAPHVAGSFLQEIFDFILRAQENLLEPEILLKRFIPGKYPLLAELSSIYSKYGRALKESRQYNYGMLLIETAKMLDNDANAKRRISEKYKYIIVDEFQETNTAQQRIISGMAGGNFIFFGNDDQAIYGFRGSVTDNFKHLYRKLKGQGKVYFLSLNHRSTDDILKLSDNFIAINKDRIEKANIACRKNDNGGEIGVRSFSTVIEEVSYICQKIEALNTMFGVKFEDMAILVKGLGYETHLIEDALAGSGIPFIRRNSRSLMDNSYVSYVIDFLRLASMAGKEDSNGNLGGGGDIASLIENVLLSKAVGMDPLFYSKLRSAYFAEGKKKKISLWTYLDKYLKEDMGEAWKDEILFKDRLARVSESIRYYSKKMEEDLLDFLLEFLDDPLVGLFKFLDSDMGADSEGRAISISIGDYLKSVMEYIQSSSATGIRPYLLFIENLETNQFLEEVEESIEDQVQPGMVNILSFHQCKGMEFDAVFLPFINKNYLPSRSKNQQVFDVHLFRTIAGARELTPAGIQKEHIEGEIRLFYNGITRAKRYLYVTSCRAKKNSVFFEKMAACRDDLEKAAGRPLEDKKILNRGRDRKWDLRKKSMVAFYRMEKCLKTDPYKIFSALVGLDSAYPPDDWWDPDRVTVNKKIPLEHISRSFSYTGLETYRDCPFKYKIQYYFGISGEENISLVIGKAYHEVLQRFFNDKRGDYGWERLENIIKEVFEKKDPGFPSLKEEITEKALSDFKRYYVNYLPGEPILSEMEKDFQFDIHGYSMRGRIDQINRTSDGAVELVDFKSGSARYSSQDLEDEIQLKLYRLAVERDKDFKMGPASSIRMKYISLGAEKNGEYFLPEEYFDHKAIEEKITGIASRITGMDFRAVPKSYMTCTYCDYEIICPRFYGKYD